MRLWSIDLDYLDAKGLGALWREGLGAMKALDAYVKGEKCGYQNHPQLDRFKKCSVPNIAIRVYMINVYKEAKKRGFDYNKSLMFGCSFKDMSAYRDDVLNNLIDVTDKQLDYEFKLLKYKLQEINSKTGLPRNIKKYNEIKDIELPKHNKFFYLVEGDIESWEKVRKEVLK